MQEKQAISKYLRIPPRKARLAAGLVRGLPVGAAMDQLHHSPMKGARLLAKTVKSAVSNAAVAFNLSSEDMKIIEVRVDEGPRLKRMKPKNRGGRHPILKRTSHFTVVVGKL